MPGAAQRASLRQAFADPLRSRPPPQDELLELQEKEDAAAQEAAAAAERGAHAALMDAANMAGVEVGGRHAGTRLARWGRRAPLPLSPSCAALSAHPAPPPRMQSLPDDVVAGDPEWAKLAAVPGLTEPWGDVRDKWRLATEEFKASLGAGRRGAGSGRL
jgi:hypothetical protein